MREKRVQVSVRVPETVRRKLRVAALKQGLTVQQLLERLITDWLRRRRV